MAQAADANDGLDRAPALPRRFGPGQSLYWFVVSLMVIPITFFVSGEVSFADGWGVGLPLSFWLVAGVIWATGSHRFVVTEDGVTWIRGARRRFVPWNAMHEMDHEEPDRGPEIWVVSSRSGATLLRFSDYTRGAEELAAIISIWMRPLPFE